MLLLLACATAPAPFLGLGGQVWVGDTAWTAPLDALDAAPTFLIDLQAILPLTDARGADWVAHQWEAPPAWETGAHALRAELYARGLDARGLDAPGLDVLGGWDGTPEWVPALSDAAVDALAAWSVHAWDDYAEAGDGHTFLEGRGQIFTDQVNARDPARPIW